MSELFTQALFPVTLPFSIVVLGLALYWVLVAFGIFDLDGEGDSVSLADVDADVEGGGGAPAGPWGAFLHFLNFGEVPFMIVVSVFALSMWVCSMIANQFFNDGSILLGLLYLVPGFLLTVFVTRFVTLPFRKVFRLLNRGAPGEKSLVGRTCVIRTSEATPEYGQAEVASEGAPLLLQVRTREGVSLPKGTAALIIGQDESSGAFTVIQVTSDTL